MLRDTYNNASQMSFAKVKVKGCAKLAGRAAASAAASRRIWREGMRDYAYAREITGRAPALRGRPPHKEVREGMRDTNFSPLNRT